MISKITPDVWIGTTQEAAGAVAAGFTHVLNCAEECRAPKAAEDLVGYAHIPLTEEEEPVAAEQLRQGADTLQRWLSENGGVVAAATKPKILVHCFGGINRSPAVVLAWLVLYRGMTVDEGYIHIQKTRNFIRIIPYYMAIIRSMIRLSISQAS